jgi:TetR/AcrR family transcriptional regulator, repressor for uid operon
MRTADPALHAQRKAQILEAATACFITDGFHGATTAQIAKAAGISMGLLYRYYPSKDELIIAAAAQDRDQYVAAIEIFGNAVSLSAGLTEYLRVAFDRALDLGYVRLSCEVLAEAGRNPELRTTLAAGDAQVRKAMIASIKALQKRGLVASSLAPGATADFLGILVDGTIGRIVMDAATDRRSLLAATRDFVVTALTK